MGTTPLLCEIKRRVDGSFGNTLPLSTDRGQSQEPWPCLHKTAELSQGLNHQQLAHQPRWTQRSRGTVSVGQDQPQTVKNRWPGIAYKEAGCGFLFLENSLECLFAPELEGLIMPSLELPHLHGIQTKKDPTEAFFGRFFWTCSSWSCKPVTRELWQVIRPHPDNWGTVCEGE